MAGFLEKRLLAKSVQRWSDLADRASSIPPSELLELEATARKLRRKLDAMTIATADKLSPDQQSEILRPEQCDWAWRPDPWCVPTVPQSAVSVPSPHELSKNVTLFHDCAKSEITMRQLRNGRSDIPSGYATVLDVLRFDGSFLSLVVTLPTEGALGITRSHYISLRCRLTRENPIEIYARLNIQHGPNTEQMVRQMEISDDLGVAEFDLAYSNINEKRVEKIWIDLIFDNPAMNQITLWDLTLTRAPRADL